MAIIFRGHNLHYVVEFETDKILITENYSTIFVKETQNYWKLMDGTFKFLETVRPRTYSDVTLPFNIVRLANEFSDVMVIIEAEIVNSMLGSSGQINIEIDNNGNNIFVVLETLFFPGAAGGNSIKTPMSFVIPRNSQYRITKFIIGTSTCTILHVKELIL